MKKKLLIILLISLILIIIKYCFSNYNISYELNNYKINTTYKNKRLYFEISNGNIKYNFDIYKNRNIYKIKINNIKKLDFDNYKCIIPEIKNINTYPLCYDEKNNYLVDYNSIDNELLYEYKKEEKIIQKPNKDFIYYNNLNKNEYVALWVYNGYIIMNNKGYNLIKIFNKDKYDNNLAYIINNNIYMPNYDEEYEYKSLIVLDITNGKYKKLDLDTSIDYDSYIVGNIKNNLYIFDNKSSILYEININNGKVKIKSSNDIGFVKYENNEFVKCSKSEYKVDKIKYESNNSNYKYILDNGTYKIIKDNNNIKTKINNEEIIKIYEKNNNLYYVLDDSFYLYNPISGNIKILYNYELSFNNTNMVFMYIN